MATQHAKEDTDGINVDCPFHVAHYDKIKRNEQDIKEVWKEITTMRTWVICGMSALLLQIGIIILTKIIH